MKKLLLSTAASVLFLAPAMADSASTVTTAPATVVTHQTKMRPVHTTETKTITTKEVIHDTHKHVR